MAASDAQLFARMEIRTTEALKNIERFNSRLNSQMGSMETRTRKAAATIETSLAKSFDKAGMSATSMSRVAIGALGGLSAALSVREVIAYAEAWTRAGNSLAVAGITGERQKQVLDALFASAQRNATPIEAITDLYGKAAQASDVLGASQDELIKFTDGVAVALQVSGKSATEASGALQQLGQLLGSSRVAAEEFNSVNEGARPILMAVANGLDEAGGSVSKLKKLVNDGKVSGQQFFQAFLRGLPTIQAMAANTTRTIDQGLTRVRNAMTKYVGETDKGLGASQRLVTALNSLADNFDQTADTTLKFAAIIAGAFVGRAIGGMLAALPAAAGAVLALSTAMRAGSVSAALLSRSLGPIGLIIGIATAAAAVFVDWGTSIDDTTRKLAEQAKSGDAIEAMIADVKKAQDAYKASIASTAGAQTSASNSIVADTKREFEAKKSLLELELKRQQALLAVQSASIAQKGADLKTEIGNQVFTRVDTNRTGFSDPAVGRLVNLPDDITGLAKTQAAIDASPITDEIKKIRAEQELTTISAEKLKEALNSTFSDTGGTTTNNDPGNTGSKGGKAKADEDALQKAIDGILARTAATKAETAAQQALNPFVKDYGLALETAKVKQELLNVATQAGIALSPQQRAEIDAVAGAYANATAAAAKLDEQQSQLATSVSNLKSDTASFITSFRTGLQEGKTAVESLGDALTSLSNTILTRLETRLSDVLINGLLGVLGGPATTAFNPMTAIQALWAEGGYTGNGGKYQPAGVVHKGEFVMSAKATRSIGAANLEALHQSALKGYASGGLVASPRLPAAPRLGEMRSGARSDGKVEINIVNNSSARMETRERSTPNGGKRQDILFEDAAASTLRPGSSMDRAMRNRGARPPLART
jgi:tape measure domain-containing protein